MHLKVLSSKCGNFVQASTFNPSCTDTGIVRDNTVHTVAAITWLLALSNHEQP